MFTKHDLQFFKSINWTGFHQIFSPLEYGFTKWKTKKIDDVNIILLSIGLYGLAKNAYMSI